MVSAQVEPGVGSAAVSNVASDWPQPVVVITWLIPEPEQWVALAEQFDIVGAGASPEAAIANMDELLLDYFELVAEDGGSFADAHRPISLPRRARLRANWLLGNLSDALHKVRHVQRLPHEAPCPG